jgi:hypothetical protein
MRTHLILFFSLLMFASAGCSTSPNEAGDNSGMPSLDAQISPSQEPTGAHLPVSPTQGVPTHMSQSMPSPFTPDLQNLIEKAREHLANRLSISIDQVIFIAAYDVTWPDSSLGCPQEGMAYAQVLTPGYLIQLEHGSIQYEYHSGKSMQQVVSCENPGQPLPGNPDSY